LTPHGEELGVVLTIVSGFMKNGTSFIDECVTEQNSVDSEEQQVSMTVSTNEVASVDFEIDCWLERAPIAANDDELPE